MGLVSPDQDLSKIQTKAYLQLNSVVFIAFTANGSVILVRGDFFGAAGCLLVGRQPCGGELANKVIHFTGGL